jgi:hypothetical protein
VSIPNDGRTIATDDVHVQTFPVGRNLVSDRERRPVGATEAACEVCALEASLGAPGDGDAARIRAADHRQFRGTGDDTHPIQLSLIVAGDVGEDRDTSHLSS